MPLVNGYSFAVHSRTTNDMHAIDLCVFMPADTWRSVCTWVLRLSVLPPGGSPCTRRDLNSTTISWYVSSAFVGLVPVSAHSLCRAGTGQCAQLVWHCMLRVRLRWQNDFFSRCVFLVHLYDKLSVVIYLRVVIVCGQFCCFHVKKIC